MQASAEGSIIIGVETSVNEIFRHLGELTGFRGAPIYTIVRQAEVHRIALNPSYAKQWLGWAPQTTLLDGLRRTVAWFRSSR